MSIFLKFGGVLGDVEDAGHVNWIDVKAVNWTLARPVSNPAGSTAGRVLSAAQVSELTIVKDQDVASIPLIQAAFEGSPVAAQIDFCSTGSGQQTVYYSIAMTNTLITGIGQSGSDGRPSESVTSQLHTDFVFRDADGPGRQSSFACKLRLGPQYQLISLRWV